MSVLHRYALILPVLTLGVAPAAHAQAGYFMPPSQQQSPQVHSPMRQATPEPAHSAQAPAAQAQAAPQPPIPQLPPLPQETAPPTAIVGVLSVPDVMQRSTAAQGVQAEIQKRQAALKGEEEKAQSQFQAERQQILGEQGKISAADFDKKVQDWQNSVVAAQTKLREKNQAIQNAGQAALGQIEAELIGIIRQEAQAHGMNLILHREDVVLNVAAFDLTDETVTELNKLLPSVKVPPSVVTPGMAITPPDQGPYNGQ